MLIETSRQAGKARTRQALLAAGREVLARDGLAGATTRRVAEAAGVAHGTFFVHFPSLEALVEVVLDEVVAEALARGQASLPRRAGLVGQLVHVCGALYDAYRASPELARAAIAASLFQGEPEGPSRRRLAEFEAWVTERVAAAVAAGAVKPLPPALAFAGFFSLYFGVLVAGLRGQLDAKAQRATLTLALQRWFQVTP